MTIGAPSAFEYDLIIIGTGTDGGTIAQRLAPSGKRILMLERGDFIPKEKENWDVNEVVVKGRYRPDETWFDKDNQPFKPFTHYVLGGNSKVYGAASFRMREHDFQETRHAAGVSPAWPLTYADLAPYYRQAEQLLSVHGLRGADPTEPTGTERGPTEPYPFEPLAPEPFAHELYQNVVKAGLQPFPIPMAVWLSQDKPDRPDAPTVLGNFDGFPDPTEAKADAHVTGVRAALHHPDVTLLTNARVTRLDTEPTGRRITAVQVQRNGPTERGPTETYQAGVVVLAVGAIKSAALLLRSASEQHANGLANGSGQVGRNYMAHINGCLIAYTPDKLNTSFFQKYFCIGDYYAATPNNTEPLGEIQLMGKNDPPTVAEAELLKLILYLRVGETSDIGSTAVWLASDESDYIHGTSIFVDSGMTLYPGFTTNG